MDPLRNIAGFLPTAQQQDEPTSMYGRAIAVAGSDRVSQPELDVASYLRAEHLLSMKRHHDVITAVEEITSESMLHAPARALEAAALAELGRPGAVETAIVAASAARTEEQAELKRGLKGLGGLFDVVIVNRPSCMNDSATTASVPKKKARKAT